MSHSNLLPWELPSYCSGWGYLGMHWLSICTFINFLNVGRWFCFFQETLFFVPTFGCQSRKNNVSQNIKHFKQSKEGKWEVGKRGKKEEFLFCFLFPDTHLYSKLARSLLKWILVVCICLPSFSISLSLAKTCQSINSFTHQKTRVVI